MRRRIGLLLLLVSAVAFGFLKSVDIEPVKASWSGWTRRAEPNNYIAQTITANFDSVSSCDVFLGDTGTSHADVVVEIYEYPDGLTRIAKNDGVAQTRSHYWLHLPLTTESGQTFTRGKQYLVKFTRSSGQPGWPA